MIIDLEEPFKSVYSKGYLRVESDGRKYVSLYNCAGDQRSISYARYLYSVRMGYEIPGDIEIDHRDGDKSNDSFDNLRPMTIQMHRDKTYFERLNKDWVDLVCPCCTETFRRSSRYLRDKRSQGQVEFYCSRSCSTKMNTPMKKPLEVIEQIRELKAEGKSSYFIASALGVARNTVMKHW
ncbi:hypothetical protein LUCX_148 [Xanthomonas phage vB_XciM_LucasX]|nr:hypothetical protein LUCX_148 [Xanthomonas phage vB_XciM_LucasX]